MRRSRFSAGRLTMRGSAITPLASTSKTKGRRMRTTSPSNRRNHPQTLLCVLCRHFTQVNPGASEPLKDRYVSYCTILPPAGAVSARRVARVMVVMLWSHVGRASVTRAWRAGATHTTHYTRSGKHWANQKSQSSRSGSSQHGARVREGSQHSDTVNR